MKHIEIDKMISGKVRSHVMQIKGSMILGNNERTNDNNSKVDTSVMESVAILPFMGIFLRLCLPMADRYASIEIIIQVFRKYSELKVKIL